MKIENYPEVITEGYPKLMRVWDINKESNHLTLVICKVPDAPYPYKTLKASSEGSIYAYKNAEDLPTTKPRTIEYGLVEGDIITNGNSERLVLGVCGKLIFVSNRDDFNAAYSYYTLHEVIKEGWKLKQETTQTETIPEMTMEEVCAALGKEVKIKK